MAALNSAATLRAGVPPALREAFANIARRDEHDDLRRALLRHRDAAAPACGQISSDGSTIVGRDGWLFLHAGNNAWHEQAAGRFTLTPAGCSLWLQLLQRRRDWLVARGIRHAHLFVPEKACVYPELQPEPTPPSALRPVMQLVSMQLVADATPGIHYPAVTLRAGKALAPTYYRSNSHWTAFGAYLACSALWQQLGIVPVDDWPPLALHPIQQDLAVKFPGLPDENWHQVDVAHLLVHSNEAQVQGHVGRFKHLHNAQARNDCRVLICGDSYAFDHNLAAWFALQCRDVFCAWQVGVQQALVEQVAPDVVVSQMAERFVTRLPQDQLG